MGGDFPPPKKNVLCSPNVAVYVPGRNNKTIKPCYRKDDRAMRPIYECPEKFRESLATPTATFPEIVNGLLLRSIV